MRPGFLLTMLCMAPFVACHPIQPEPMRQQKLKSEDVASAITGDRAFAMRLYAELARPNQNVFFSPASVRMALTMLWLGARTNTADELQHTLDFNGDPLAISNAWRGVRAFWDAPTPKGQDFTLKIANGLFSALDQEFSQGYLELCADRYGAPLARLDFHGAAETSRSEINRWVEKHTEGKITDLLEQGAIQPETRFILVNAVYFKAGWVTQFDSRLTHKADFQRSDGRKLKTDMMSRSGPHAYAEVGDVQVLELPYQGDGFVMDVLLPRGDVSVLEASLADARKLDELTGQVQEKNVDVLLPRISLATRYHLADVLKKLGMQTAFVKTKADFSGMDGKRDIYIDDIVHQTFVKVNEQETEAAAATAVEAKGGGPPPASTQFHADHPFLFMIRDKKRNALLFLGKVVDPTQA